MYLQFSVIYIPLLLLNYNGLSTATPLSSLGPQTQQKHFGEGVRDWFYDVKERILGSVRPEVPPMLTQVREENADGKKVFGEFWLDMSNLSIDPAKDWGFRLGHWYFIRKNTDSDVDVGVNPANQAEPIDWFEYNVARDAARKKTSNFPVFITTTESVAAPTTTAIESMTSAILNANDKDNETYDHSRAEQSAEVVSPTS